MALRPNQNVTITSPSAVHTLVKTIQVALTDTTAFNAFVLPKGAVVSGVYVMGSTAANGTASLIQVGTNPGTADEIVNDFDVTANGVGYFAAGATGGSAIGTQLTADTLYKARFVADGADAGGPWLVKVEYYIPQQGFSF